MRLQTNHKVPNLNSRPLTLEHEIIADSPDYRQTIDFDLKGTKKKLAMKSYDLVREFLISIITHTCLQDIQPCCDVRRIVASQWFSSAIGTDVSERQDVLQGSEYAGICGTLEYEFVVTG